MSFQSLDMLEEMQECIRVLVERWNYKNSRCMGKSIKRNKLRWKILK